MGVVKFSMSGRNSQTPLRIGGAVDTEICLSRLCHPVYEPALRNLNCRVVSLGHEIVCLQCAEMPVQHFEPG